MLFGTTVTIVERLLQLDESHLPARARVGHLDALAGVSAPLFEVSVGPAYLARAANALVEGDLCSDGGPCAPYRAQVQEMNRAVVRSLDRLTRDRAAAILAMNISQPFIDALVGMSDQEVVRVEDHAARPLIQFRLTEAAMDQLFSLGTRPAIEPGLATWLVLVHTTRQEIATLPRADPAIDGCYEAKVRAGRAEDMPFSKELSDMARSIGELGGCIKTARKLLGAQANGLGIRRILKAARGRRPLDGSLWNVTLVTKLMAAAIVLMSMRLYRNGYGFSHAQVLTFAFYRTYLAPGSKHVLKIEDYVDKIALPLLRSTAWLAYADQFEAAYLVIEDGDQLEVCQPHQNLLRMGRIGSAASRRKERRSEIRRLKHCQSHTGAQAAFA